MAVRPHRAERDPQAQSGLRTLARHLLGIATAPNVQAVNSGDTILPLEPAVPVNSTALDDTAHIDAEVLSALRVAAFDHQACGARGERTGEVRGSRDAKATPLQGGDR